MGLVKIAFILVSLTGVLSLENSPLSTIAEWKNVDYQFPDATSRQAAINNRNWVAANQVMIDVGVSYATGKARIFVTIPKFQTGVPISVGTLSSTSTANGPLIIPYPDYSWHSSNGANCDGITSVFRIAIDPCNRIWILDTGMIGSTQYCPPQILVFNLKTDTLIRRYRFPANQYRPGTSLFVTPIVDVRDAAGTCADTMVYIADVSGFGIVMYSFKNNNSWRAQNKLMYADYRYGTHNISRESFDLMDGVLGMSVSDAIGPQIAYRYSTTAFPLTGSDRFLYFHGLSAGNECAVPLRYLDNKALWDANVEAVPRAFIELGSRDVQSAAEAIDCNGNLFFGLNTPNAIACWHPDVPYTKPNIHIIAESDVKLQFASGVKIVTNTYGKQELWTMTCRFQKVMTGSMVFTEVNFRIQFGLVTSLLSGAAKCY